MHHFVLAGEHMIERDRKTLDLDAMLCKGVARVLVVFRRLQQRLRRDTSDVGACPTRRGLAVERLPVIDASRLEPELRRANRRNVAAGTRTDNDDIEGFGHGGYLGASPYRSRSIRAGSSKASLIATSDSTASRPSMMR